MKKTITLVGLLVGITAILGCDWTSGGGVESWNTRWNWVNFSGVYRGVGGSPLVADFTAIPGTPGTPATPGTPGETRTVRSERIATGTAADSTYGGVLNRSAIVPGSVMIHAGQFSLQDQGDGQLTGGTGTSGSIQYGSGGWSINLQSSPGQGTPITASYQYEVEGTDEVPGTEGTDALPPGPGSTGITIHTFTIHQEGETLQITDNNGSTYSGRMGGVRGTGGFDGDGLVTEGDTIIAQFTAKGVSAANMEVEMTGTFQGVITSGGAGQTGRLDQRQMFGTWIESGGRTGDINGQTSPITVTIPGGTDE